MGQGRLSIGIFRELLEGVKNAIDTVVGNYVGEAQKQLEEKGNWIGATHTENEVEKIEDKEEKQGERGYTNTEEQRTGGG